MASRSKPLTPLPFALPSKNSCQVPLFQYTTSSSWTSPRPGTLTCPVKER